VEYLAGTYKKTGALTFTSLSQDKKEKNRLHTVENNLGLAEDVRARYPFVLTVHGDIKKNGKSDLEGSESSLSSTNSTSSFSSTGIPFHSILGFIRE